MMPQGRGPSPGAYANRKFMTVALATIGLLTFTWLVFFRADPQATALPYSYTPIHHVDVGQDTLKGDAIMPKLGNETLKAELGRASWKLFHTMMARFPDTPTEDEQTALFSYIHLFARLYPCGECAGHFRQILNKFPPQTATRSTAAAWACHVHNEVNKSLKKPSFDCSNIGDFYDCGCADEGKDEKGKSRAGTKEGEFTPGKGNGMVADMGVKDKEGYSTPDHGRLLLDVLDGTAG